MKLSIIIAAWNNQATISQALQSILEQTYQNIEVWVIDGGSTDQTLNILKDYQQKFQGRLHYISEKDKGISDAFNKGLQRSDGDYIYFLGADDYFWHKEAVTDMLQGLNPAKDMLVCGRMARVDMAGNVRYITACAPICRSQFLWKMPVPHQALFTHRSFFEKYGLFDTEIIFSMDYDILLRAYRYFPGILMKDVIVAAWREGGIGTNRIPKVLAEFHRDRLKNKVAPGAILWGIYQWTLFKHYTKKFLFKLGCVKYM